MRKFMINHNGSKVGTVQVLEHMRAMKNGDTMVLVCFHPGFDIVKTMEVQEPGMTITLLKSSYGRVLFTSTADGRDWYQFLDLGNPTEIRELTDQHQANPWELSLMEFLSESA